MNVSSFLVSCLGGKYKQQTRSENLDVDILHQIHSSHLFDSTYLFYSGNWWGFMGIYSSSASMSVSMMREWGVEVL